MFCKNCGKEIEKGAKFCPNCGTALENKISEGCENKESAEVAEKRNQKRTQAKNLHHRKVL